MPKGLVLGTKVRIMSGIYAKTIGTIDSNVYGETVLNPAKYAGAWRDSIRWEVSYFKPEPGSH